MSQFRNPWPHAPHRLTDIFKWKLKLGHKEIPEIPGVSEFPARRRPVEPSEIATPPLDGWRILWLGHASFLIQGKGISILIDPVFSQYCAPVPLPGLRRVVDPPCGIEDLPQIDAVLITHGHYDHLDLQTLRKIGPTTRIVIAEGHSGFLKKMGFQNSSELSWGNRLELVPGVGVTAVPAQHFTARTPWDRNRGHWCGWLIDGLNCKLWHAGDSGYCPAFAEIGGRCGPIDFGMIPIGAYMPRQIMRAMHMNPEEAVQAFVEAGCLRAVAMHWGTFRLTDEPLGEPPIRLSNALRARGIEPDRFEIADVGASRIIKNSATC